MFEIYKVAVSPFFSFSIPNTYLTSVSLLEYCQCENRRIKSFYYIAIMIDLLRAFSEETPVTGTYLKH